MLPRVHLIGKVRKIYSVLLFDLKIRKGGILIESPRPVDLQVGQEVEITGTLSPHNIADIVNCPHCQGQHTSKGWDQFKVLSEAIQILPPQPKLPPDPKKYREKIFICYGCFKPIKPSDFPYKPSDWFKNMGWRGYYHFKCLTDQDQTMYDVMRDVEEHIDTSHLTKPYRDFRNQRRK